ncbi:chymotrypsin-2-like isoform X2 [Macrosteles quadrilineatus]|uniref:chymotrypsin-2-like isoform X2 n=1 Tax=Macrosteles quadrilineatus TaxID=74068 RepID=UPI0023E16B2F|nr:chymotrypsin-2-like isoform X2 [Macrosteles quadrilineatus]
MWISLIFAVSLGRAYSFTTIHHGTKIEEPSDTTSPQQPTEEYNTEETTITETVIVDDFSHVVAILHKNNFLLGAGAIVGDKWILATAFQIGAFKPDQLCVRVGSQSAVSGGQLLKVDQVFVHPMFKQFNNDVALLKTADAILLSETAKLIPVSETSPSMGDAAVLWTWNSDSTVYKNQADILPMSECKAFYPDFDLTESNVCAVLDHVLPFQVSLYGSPLVYKGALVGLYMGMEANVYKPSLCSNLSPLVGWVHAMMKNETATQLLFPLSN